MQRDSTYFVMFRYIHSADYDHLSGNGIQNVCPPVP